MTKEKRIRLAGTRDTSHREKNSPLNQDSALLALTLKVWDEFCLALNKHNISTNSFNKNTIYFNPNADPHFYGVMHFETGLIELEYSLIFQLREYLSCLTHEMGHYFAVRDIAKPEGENSSDYDSRTLRAGLQIMADRNGHQTFSFLNEAVNELFTKGILSEILPALKGAEHIPHQPDSYHKSIEFLDELLENLIIGWNNPQYRNNKTSNKKTTHYRLLREQKVIERLKNIYPEFTHLNKDILLDLLYKVANGAEHYSTFATIIETVYGADSFSHFAMLSQFVDEQFDPIEEDEKRVKKLRNFVRFPKKKAGNSLKLKSAQQTFALPFEDQFLVIDPTKVSHISRKKVVNDYEPFPIHAWAMETKSQYIDELMNNHPVTEEYLHDIDNWIYQFIVEQGENLFSSVSADKVGLIRLPDEDETDHIVASYDWISNFIIQDVLKKSKKPYRKETIAIGKRQKINLTFFQLEAKENRDLIIVEYINNKQLVSKSCLFLEK